MAGLRDARVQRQARGAPPRLFEAARRCVAVQSPPQTGARARMSKIIRCATCGRRERRGTSSNALYWMLLSVAAAKINNKGQTYSAETLHHYYKSRFLGCDDFVLPNGKTLVIPHSTADLDAAEFSDYMTQVEADLAERDIFLDEMPT